MNVDNELMDFEAAGSLAEELPWWGWLEDGRSCLTRAGELMSIGRVTPSVLDGQTPEQLDRVIDRWQRMLSGVDSQTRLYFYLLRRPVQFENQADGDGSSVAALGRRKRQAFLEERVQSVSAYVAWAHDPGLSAVTTQKTGGPWWMAYAKNWMARRRNRHESVYLHSSIEGAAARFRQLVEASRALVDDLTPIRVLTAPNGAFHEIDLEAHISQAQSAGSGVDQNHKRDHGESAMPRNGHPVIGEDDPEVRLVISEALAGHPRSRPAPDNRNRRCKTSPRNPTLGKTTAATPLLWPSRPARFHSRLRAVGCGPRRWGYRPGIRGRDRMGGTDWEGA